MRAVLLIAVLWLGMVCPPALAAASDPARVGAAAAPESNVLRRTFYKSLSYQALSSLDDFAFGYLFAGGITAGAFLVVANMASELAVNYAHDLTWTVASRTTGTSEAESRPTRTLTYTAVNALRTYGLGLLFTQNHVISLGYVGFNAAADAAVYFLNDVAWDRFWPADQPTAPRLPLLAPAAP